MACWYGKFWIERLDCGLDDKEHMRMETLWVGFPANEHTCGSLALAVALMHFSALVGRRLDMPPWCS
jgi:hypothetical protein